MALETTAAKAVSFPNGASFVSTADFNIYSHPFSLNLHLTRSFAFHGLLTGAYIAWSERDSDFNHLMRWGSIASFSRGSEHFPAGRSALFGLKYGPPCLLLFCFPIPFYLALYFHQACLELFPLFIGRLFCNANHWPATSELPGQFQSHFFGGFQRRRLVFLYHGLWRFAAGTFFFATHTAGLWFS